MNYKKVIKEFFGKDRIFIDQRKSLVVLLGSFADFDSFEYSQQLSAQSNRLARHSVDLILIGIGSEKSKESFCKFNKIDIKNVFAVKNAALHKKLNLNAGFVSNASNYKFIDYVYGYQIQGYYQGSFKRLSGG